MGRIYDSLTKFFEKPLEILAKEYGYSEENLLILKDEKESLKKQFPGTWNNISSCLHNADERGVWEYAKDLVSSWVFEDYILKLFEKNGLLAKLSGGDRTRKILPNTRISSSSDFSIECPEVNGTKRKVELINSYTSYWKEKNKLDLRDNKYSRLKREESIILGIDFYYRDFFLIDLRREYEVDFIKEHKPFGGKAAYAVNIKNIGTYPFKENVFLAKVKEIICG